MVNEKVNIEKNSCPMTDVQDFLLYLGTIGPVGHTLRIF